MYSYETLKLPYVVRHIYTPDWVITTGSGNTIIVEAKGRFMPGDTTKMITVAEQHPDLDIRFVFMKPDLPVRGGAKMTMSEWADKHGFGWAEGRVPATWIS